LRSRLKLEAHSAAAAINQMWLKEGAELIGYGEQCAEVLRALHTVEGEHVGGDVCCDGEKKGCRKVEFGSVGKGAVTRLSTGEGSIALEPPVLQSDSQF